MDRGTNGETVIFQLSPMFGFMMTSVKVQEANKNLPVPTPGTPSDGLTQFLEKMSKAFCLQTNLKVGFKATCIQRLHQIKSKCGLY